MDENLMQNYGAMDPRLANVTPGNKEQAMLMVYSPRRLQNQVVRPYMYSFPNGVVEHLSQYEDMQEAVGYTPEGIRNEYLNSSVIPSADGVVLRTQDLEGCWTFALVIDVPYQTMIKRYLISGYFDREPLTLDATGNASAVNENAYMFFTSTTNVRLRHHYNAGGSQEDLQPGMRGKIIPSQSEWLAGEDLYVMNPSRLSAFTSTSVSGDNNITGSVTSYGDLSVRPGSGDSGFKTSPMYAQNPKQHVRGIVQAVNAALDETTAGKHNIAGAPNGPQPPLADSQDQQFLSGAASQMASSEDWLFELTQMNLRRPMSMDEFMRMFPDAVIHPVRVNPDPQWDSRDQEIQCPQNIFSYMVAQVVQQSATSQGIGTIAFRYSSWANNSAVDPSSPNNGAWELHNVQMMVETTQEMIRQCLTQFKRMLEIDLFPVLMTNFGDFDMMVRYDANQTLVDLKFLDFPQYNTGVLEYSGALGGMEAPTVGGADLVEWNTTQLSQLLTDFSGKFTTDSAEAKFNGMSAHPEVDGNEGVVFPDVDTQGTAPDPVEQALDDAARQVNQ